MFRPIPSLIMPVPDPKPSGTLNNNGRQIYAGGDSTWRRPAGLARFRQANTHRGKRNKSMRNPHARRRGKMGDHMLRKVHGILAV